VTGRREFEGSQERDEGCQRHVLDELSSDWTCLSFFSPLRPSLPGFRFRTRPLPFSLPTRRSRLAALSLSLSLSLLLLLAPLALVTAQLPDRSSGGLDEPTSRAVNGNEARLKRMMASVTRGSGWDVFAK